MDEKIYAAFSRRKGWLGRLIRFFEGHGDVDHALILFQSNGKWKTVGAMLKGIEILDLEDFMADRAIRHAFSPVGWSLEAGFKAHLKDIGKPYDLLGLIGMAGVEAWKKVSGGYAPNFLSQSGHEICSQWLDEIIVSGLLAAGKAPDWSLFHVDPREIDPATEASACLGSTLFHEESLSNIFRS